MQGKQRDVNRELVPAVQEAMRPGYHLGFAEAGTGSHRRRVNIIETHVDTHRQGMFMQAIKPITGSLNNLVEEVGGRAAAALAKLPPIVEVNSGVLWMDGGAAGREARARLVAPFEVAACEGRRALQKLLESQGEAAAAAAAAAGGAEDDDGIEDVTAEAMAARRAEEEASRIDLTDAGGGGGADPKAPPSGEGAWVKVEGGGGGTGQARVKPEPR